VRGAHQINQELFPTLAAAGGESDFNWIAKYDAESIASTVANLQLVAGFGLPALAALTDIARAVGIDLRGSIASFDGVGDSKINRKAIRNLGLIPDISENRRGRKKTKRGKRCRFDRDIFRERFRTIERAFAREDKFRWQLLRLERISAVHYALKTLAHTTIDLRRFCRA
jgi:hypothetical protein